MADDDKLIAEVYRKIDRERALITAATNMRQSTNNPVVQGRVDSNIRDSRKNIAYLEEQLKVVQLRNMPGGEDGGPPPPSHGGRGQANWAGRGRERGPNGPVPPPKDSRGYYNSYDSGSYGDLGPGGYSAGGTAVVPPRAPYTERGPKMSKAKPNFSRLGTGFSVASRVTLTALS